MPPKRLTRPSVFRTMSFMAPAPCRARTRSRAAAAARAPPDQHHQEQADPEGPVLRGDARDHVVHQLEHHGARDPAIQPAHAANHQHQHHIGRPLQGEHVQRGKTGGLRQQGTGRTGHAGGHGVGHRQPRGHRNADGHRAQPVVAHGHQRGAKRRMHQAPRQQEDHQQHGERVPGRRLARSGRIQSGPAGAHHHALQPVGSAGQPVQLVGQFQQDQAMPSVTMRRVRSVPRMMVNEQTAPSAVAATMPTARPTSGSGITCLANSAAE
jgi:hypothetical protein